jgi:putative ABC transport system substrate-binding protein
MRRREFIALMTAAAAPAACSALAAHAQQVPVIGFLNTQLPESFALYVEAYRQGLGELGYTEGRNVAIEYRWARGQNDRLAPMAAELVERRVSVLVTTGGDVAALAGKKATSTIPQVFLLGGDPVRLGVVPAFNRPGGNVTGATLLSTTLDTKRLGLLRALLPSGTRIALLINPNFPETESRKNAVLEAARSTGHEIVVFSARDADEIDKAFKDLAGQRTEALLVSGNPFFNSRREQIVALAAHVAMPAIYEWREFAATGGLMSYGTQLPEQYRQVGRYTGRVLRGEKPADMPILLPTKFELVLNLKTVRALGLTVPATLLMLWTAPPPARECHGCGGC